MKQSWDTQLLSVVTTPVVLASKSSSWKSSLLSAAEEEQEEALCHERQCPYALRSMGEEVVIQQGQNPCAQSCLSLEAHVGENQEEAVSPRTVSLCTLWNAVKGCHLSLLEPKCTLVLQCGVVCW